VANRHVPDYGVWTVLPIIHAAISDPASLIPKDFVAKQGVVIQEIRRYKGDFKYNCWDAFSAVIMPPTNPWRYSALGTEETVRALTPQIVAERANRVMIPEGLVVSASTKGGTKSAARVISILDQFTETLPQSGRKPVRVAPSEYGRVNPDFKDGEIYSVDLSSRGFNNGLVMMYFVWLLESTPWTLETFAQTSFLEAASKRFSSRVRVAGMGYEDQPVNLGLGEEKRVVGFSLLRSKDTNFVQTAKQLVDDLVIPTLNDFGPTEISHISDLAVKRARAVPPTRSTRFADVISGLRHHGRIIDSNAQDEIHLQVTAGDLKIAQQQLLASRPAIIVVGDLS